MLYFSHILKCCSFWKPEGDLKKEEGINWLLWASVDRKLKRPILPPAPAKKYKPSDQRNKIQEIWHARNATKWEKQILIWPAKKYKHKKSSHQHQPRNTNLLTSRQEIQTHKIWIQEMPQNEEKKHPRLLPFYNSSPIFMKGCKPHSTLTYNPLYLLLPRALNINESFQRFPKGDVECAHKIQSWNKNTREDINQGICFHEGIWKEEKQSAEIFQFSSQIKNYHFWMYLFE